MSQAYESEKADLQTQIDEIENEIVGVSQESNSADKFIPPDFEKELTEEEIAEMKRIEAIKDKRHQAYLRRKESGWQAQYEAKQKAKRKARMDKKKNAVRQEDNKKGVFIPVSEMPVLTPRKAVRE